MAANGISTLPTKQDRQVAKLNIAQAKREGKVVANNGTISGDVDPSKPYYRVNNQYDIELLPTQYVVDTPVDNPNPDGLVLGRPWEPME
jgi:hypothetical protein